MSDRLSAIKKSPLYQTCMKPLVWGPIWAYRYCRDRRRTRIFNRLAVEDRALLARAREEYDQVYADQQEPLVSVTTATYNRAKLLLENAVPSVLGQTYTNLEFIIIGDHCTDETAALMAKIKDPRVRFHNLPRRQQYPRSKKKRYKVHGLEAWGLARSSAKGLWIAHLDDDDVFTPDHIEKLLREAQAGDHEVVYGRSKKEVEPGRWIEQGRAVRRDGTIIGGYISHSTVLRRSYLGFIKADECLDVGLAGDAYMWRRMFNAGVRFGFVNDIVTLLPLRPGEYERTILSAPR
ncbi:MAG TPA: glycosyltransferase [Nitrospiraceae bacterium]|nr:glycosyltransferase [Nitrospiraceae bacterium]